MRHRTLDREISPDGHFDWAQRQRLLRDRNGRSRQEIQIPAESGWRCHLILDQQWTQDCRVHLIETGSCEEFLYVRHAARCGRRRRLARSNQAKKILGSGISSGPTKVRLARTPEEFAGIQHGAARYHVGDSWAGAKSWADRSPCRQDRWR
jgi:hypothetical protein